jgi:hypothetical protein
MTVRLPLQPGGGKNLAMTGGGTHAPPDYALKTAADPSAAICEAIRGGLAQLGR